MQLLIPPTLIVALFSCNNTVGENSNVQNLPKTMITALVWAPDWSEEMHQIAIEFTKTHPQIDVDVQFMIGNSVEENIKPKVAANNLPDIMSVNPNAYSAELADQGILADVSGSAAWNNMLDSLKQDWVSKTNKHFGISGGVAATLIYYNKEMFKRAKITALPTNFEEFLRVCEQLKKADMTPIVLSGAYPNALANGPFSFGFANNVVPNQPDWKMKIGNGSLNFNTPEVANIFAKIKLLADRNYVQKGYMTTGYAAGIDLFTKGNAAMAFQGTWASGRLIQGNHFETGVFLPPWNAVGQRTIPVIGSETGFAVCETKNKQAALQFLEFIYGKGFQIEQNKRQNIPPMKKMEGKVVSDSQIINYISTISQSPVTVSPYYSFLPASTIDMLHPLLQQVLFGKITPKNAAKMIDRATQNEAQKHYN